MANSKSPAENDLNNLKIQFLLPNTIAFCQALNRGIIQAFKLCYRKIQMWKLMSKMKDAASESILIKSVNVLNAVN